VTLSSNQRHDDYHNDEGTIASEMPVHVNTTHIMTTNEGNGGHCTSNEDCLGDENMDSHSDHQDQGKLRSKISEKCYVN
jgi:hypothetical protein